MPRASSKRTAPAPPQPSPLPWTTNPDGTRAYPVPDGPPKINPLTPEHYIALMQVLERLEVLQDAICRAAHAGVPVDAHAAATETHHAVARQILALYPPPTPGPLE